jgi:hypothetical protein
MLRPEGDEYSNATRACVWLQHIQRSRTPFHQTYADAVSMITVMRDTLCFGWKQSGKEVTCVHNISAEVYPSLCLTLDYTYNSMPRDGRGFS